jgi:hypothetical protein
VYDYGSDQKRLLETVADGGTLWLVTSRRKANQPRTYHLAYKLVECYAIAPYESLFSGRWKYVVRAKDWSRSRHFKYNEALSSLKRLRFSTGKPMAQVANVGLRLLTIPELTPDDVAVLERLQHKIEDGRAIFISYTRADRAAAEELEHQLAKRDISTSRDVAFLKPGQEWAAALRNEVLGTDCFLVLVSAESAKSEWVRREVSWALTEYAAGGLVQGIVPVRLGTDGWNDFPELHRFEWWQYPREQSQGQAFDKLAKAIAIFPARTRSLGGTE